MELGFVLIKAVEFAERVLGREELDNEMSNKYKNSKHSHGLGFVPLPINQIGKPNNL